MKKIQLASLIAVSTLSANAFAASKPIKLAQSNNNSASSPMNADLVVEDTNPMRAKTAAAKKKTILSKKSVRGVRSGAPAAPVSDQLQMKQSSTTNATATAPASASAAPITASPSSSPARKGTSSRPTTIPNPANGPGVRPVAPALSSTQKDPGYNKKVAIPNLTFGINNYYNGATIKDPVAGYQPDADSGFDGSPAELTTHFAFGYKATDNLTVSINPQFSTTPNYRTYDSKTEIFTSNEGTFMKPVGSFLKLGVGSFVKSGIFNWSGDFRFYPSITDDLKGTPDKATGEFRDQQHLFRTGQNFSWQINEKWGFEIPNIVRYSIRPSEFQNGRRSILLETQPNVSYAFSDSFSGSMTYVMTARQNYGESISSWHDSATYLEPGVTWNMGFGFIFNPYVDIRTGNRANADTTAIGFNLFWSIL